MKPYQIQFNAKWIKKNMSHEFDRGDLRFEISKAKGLWNVSVFDNKSKTDTTPVTSFEIKGKLQEIKTQCENFES